MSVFLTVFLLVGGVWVPGELYDGWGPVEYDTLERCQVAEEFFNRTDTNFIYAKCVTTEE